MPPTFIQDDIYKCILSLFDPQEKHHYSTTGYTYKPTAHFMERDRVKRQVAEKKGVTLIIVPYWWDKTPDRYSYIILFLLFSPSHL